ncbi:MAG: hypothetical protein EOO16_18000 [Chitinophagaceae bacterium]|nr:MAG: hypothetical protein EOO16_18000 [Chitinophagaceae bacterium]
MASIHNNLPEAHMPKSSLTTLALAAAFALPTFNASAAFVQLSFEVNTFQDGPLTGLESGIAIGDTIQVDINAASGRTFQTNGEFSFLLWNFVSPYPSVSTTYSENLTLLDKGTVVYSYDVSYVACAGCLAASFTDPLPSFVGSFNDIRVTLWNLKGTFDPGTVIKADNQLNFVTGINTVNAAAVPEPATFVMTLVGLLTTGIAAIRGRARRSGLGQA